MYTLMVAAAATLPRTETHPEDEAPVALPEVPNQVPGDWEVPMREKRDEWIMKEGWMKALEAERWRWNDEEPVGPPPEDFDFEWLDEETASGWDDDDWAKWHHDMRAGPDNEL